ncbi:hypothetical protein BH11MYX1_BH11MYX1_31900 [soil metagenome]
MSMDFSSWPREQEQSFVVYENYTQESSKKAFTAAAIAAIAFLVVAVGIFAGVAPEEKNYAKDMNMSNLTKKAAKTEAPAPTPAPAAAPAPAPAPAAAPTGDKK